MKTIAASLQNTASSPPRGRSATCLEFRCTYSYNTWMSRHERLLRCIEDYYHLLLSHEGSIRKLSYLSVLSYCRIRRILPQHLIGAWYSRTWDFPAVRFSSNKIGCLDLPLKVLVLFWYNKRLGKNWFHRTSTHLDTQVFPICFASRPGLSAVWLQVT